MEDFMANNLYLGTADNIEEEEENWRVYGNFYDPHANGCLLDKTNKLDESLLRKKLLWYPTNVSDNNCFLRCLYEAHFSNSNIQVEDARALFNIPHDGHINDVEVQGIANQCNIQIVFYQIKTTKFSELTLELQQDREESSIIQRFEKRITISPPTISYNTPTYYFLSHKNHCYLIKKLELLIGKVKCSNCSQWIIRTNFSIHIASCYYCNLCFRSYKKKPEDEAHECKNITQRRLTPREFKEQTINRRAEVVCDQWTAMEPVDIAKRKMSPFKLWFADFEAFPDPRDEQFFIPYAIGIIGLFELEQEKVKIFYGPKCMKEYLHYLTSKCEGNLYYYNGSRFDAYLHLKGMVDYGFYIDPSAFIKQGGKILSFKHKDKLKVYDLCLFTQASLTAACKSWGVPEDKSKIEFDHEKVKSFEDAERHRKEVTSYLRLDCIALAHLFKNYHSAMWECFSIDMAKCITPATFALKAWASGCDVMKEIYIPHRGKEEDDDRAAYFGGRVMCQYQQYESKDWEGNCDYEYAQVKDYIVIGDVNSLYPSVQFEEDYAYGKWKYQTFYDEVEGSGEEHGKQMMKNINEGFMIDLTRGCFLVDITCPSDLITSFLMERDPTGAIIHNLLPKVKQWYWGCELREAIILGYRITKLWEIKSFEKSGPIFKPYIDKCWNERKKHRSGTAQNLCYKFAMNGLTGKFGQKSHETNTLIYSTNYVPDEEKLKKWEDIISKVVDFDPLFASPQEHGSTRPPQNAIMLEVLNDDTGPRYPIYLSAQILAYSRVKMSQIMRACDAYRDPARAIYYTDTDSLVLPSACIAPLVAAGHVGKGLGQLKCDLNEDFNEETMEWAKIMKGVWAATKGPYSLAYILPGEEIIMEKLKVKGIPHIDKPVPYFDPVKFELSETNAVLMERVKKWLDNPNTFQLPGAIIGQKFYLYQSADKLVSYYAKNINGEMIRQMMAQEGSVYAYYGGMKKEFLKSDGRYLMIRPTAVRRTVCKTDWWRKSKRIYLIGVLVQAYALSYPVGYIQ
jgi:hypothetical protein